MAPSRIDSTYSGWFRALEEQMAKVKVPVHTVCLDQHFLTEKLAQRQQDPASKLASSKDTLNNVTTLALTKPHEASSQLLLPIPSASNGGLGTYVA